jgi:hypothetical protein
MGQIPYLAAASPSEAPGHAPLVTGTGLTVRAGRSQRRHGVRGHPHWPCHKRAIHSGPDRSRADNYGQRRSGRDLHRSLPAQAEILPDLALQASGHGGRSRPSNWGSALGVTATTLGGLLAICWQLGAGRGLRSPFVLVGVTGIEPVTSAV